MAELIDWARAPLEALSLGKAELGANATPPIQGAKTENPIDLPPRAVPWRVWFVDDDITTLGVIEVNASTHYANVFELTLCDTLREAWASRLRDAMQTRERRPDLVVIDANLATGGRRSFEWIKEIRSWPGGLGMPIILATGVSASAVSSETVQGANQLSIEPRNWHAEALTVGAEAMLFSKNGSALFLGRLGQALPNWQHAARRRLHADTFAALATKAHEKYEAIDPLMKWLVQRLVDEFDMESSRVRWRVGNAYRLAAGAGANNSAAEHELLTEEQMPLFKILVDQTGPGENKASFWRCDDGLQPEHVGNYGDGLVGKRFIGTSVYLGSRVFGFITLLRDVTRPRFDALDEEMLTTLRTLLAAIVARQDLLQANRSRQTELLKFTQNISHSPGRTPICQYLVKLLHELIHDNDNLRSKVTCRLVNHRSATLDSHAWAGYGQKGEPFKLATDQNVYVKAVRGLRPGEYVLVEDMTNPGGAPVQRTDDQSRSELCVPILIGNCAIGAVNLEHHEIDRYRQDDAALVQAACAVAAQAMQETSSLRFSVSLMKLMEKMPDASIEVIETDLLKLLWQLTRYAALVKLKPVSARNPLGAWQVEGQIDCQLEGVDLPQLTATINHQYQNWATPDPDVAPSAGPWFPQLVARRDWLQHRAIIKTDLSAAQRLTLVEGMQTCNDAVLWLCRPGKPPDKQPGNVVPYRALLLMWGLPAPVGEPQVGMLEQLARQLSAFENMRDQARSLAETAMLGEQRARIGALMQHFRHNLNSVAAAQQQKLELLVGALGQRHWESAMAYAQMAQTTAEQLVAAYTASRVYVKVIDTSRQLVSAIIGAALQDASWTSRQSVLEVKLESTCPTDLYCSTDLAIAVMVLGTLLENAHDELTHSANSPQVIRVVAGQLGTDDDHQVYIDVSDSGGGVPEQWRDKLFKPGETTKTGQHKGQGIALVLAKGRMTDIGMDGDLEFMGNDGPGARFRIWLPQAKQA